MSTEQEASGTLYLVATPIGNLDDVSLRSLQVLRQVDRLACEDTRTTAKLLARHGIEARTVSYHEHNERRQSGRLVEELKGGLDVALVCDAGTPGLSDPGFLLVREARAAGIPVVPIPGPSAVTAALVASGLPMQPFTFAGFLPPRKGERRRAIEDLAPLPHTLVLFESPRRLASCLADLADILGPRQAAIGRELTKLHEEVRSGSLQELAEQLATESVRGEITLVIGPPDRKHREASAACVDVAGAFNQELSHNGGDRKQAMREVARRTGLSRREIYRAVLEASEKE